MTQQEWFNINPNHRVIIEKGDSHPVRAILFGGEGIDQRLVGEGEHANEAIENALTVRQQMRDVLP